MIEWLNENAGAVQAVATAILVLVTIAYVWLTRAVASATKQGVDAALLEVEATREAVEVSNNLVEVGMKQADASREQAELTARLVETAVAQTAASQAMANESRRARVMTFLPVVVPKFAGSTGNRLKIQVTNHGSGTALEVKVQWFARNPGMVGSSGLLDFAASLAPGTEIAQEVVVEGTEPLRVMAQTGGSNFSYNCEYKDINGAHYQAQVHASRFSLVPLNEAARFVLGRES